MCLLNILSKSWANYFCLNPLPNGALLMKGSPLLDAIKQVLLSLEEKGEIVLCSSTPDMPAQVIFEAVECFVPSKELSGAELSGLRALVFHAVNDERFFDWDMPTLTGLSAEEFRAVADKLPKG